MKAIMTITAGLMIVSATFAQSSRRSDGKDNNSNNDSRKKEVVNTDNKKTEDRTSTRSSTNRRNPSDQSAVNRNSSNDQNSRTRVYDNNRREPVQTHEKVVVDRRVVRTLEPRHHTAVHRNYRPVPVEVRRVKYPYRAPVRGEIYWSIELSRNYETYYPHYRSNRYHVGMRVATIPAYDAFNYVGEIARVYGRVVETYYSWETDEYFLYLGDYYPYHDFSIIIPGEDARFFSRRPEKFFDRENIEVTGLISRFEGKPEMIVKRSTQINVY